MQHENDERYDSKLRSKLNTSQKKTSSSERKAFKTKLCVSTKLDQSHPMRKVGRPLGSTKKVSFTNKNVEAKSSKMHPELVEAETKLDKSVENKNPKTEISKETENSAEKHVDHVPAESIQISKEEEQASKELVIEKETAGTERKDETEFAESKETEEDNEENEETDIKLSLDCDDSPVKVQEEKSSEDKCSKKDEDSEVRIDLETSSQEKTEDISNATDSQNDTESNSVNIPESPRPGLSEVSETTPQTDTRNEKEKDEETMDDKDQSFISYDPAIMLKDVQIKLNDCMKETSKVSEASSMEPAHDRERKSEPDHEQDHDPELEMSSQLYQDLSFGKSLRGISGRRSLSRMRHVTIREHRYSPNNSMFVNMSNTSLMPDDNEDFKILRYSTGLSDTVSTSNGSPTDKKRKHEVSEDWSSLAKKQKTESDNSLLNSSISLLKGIRRPIQVSTPVSELKFQTSKLDLSDEEANKSMNDRSNKKWCTIM